MRKLQRRPALAGVLALAVSIGTAASAQTTFATSNNPQASLRLEKVSADATVFTISQSRRSTNYVPISQSSVLRDPVTGISYKLKALDIDIDPRTETETCRLFFAPFDDHIQQVELLDPMRRNQSLYFSQVEFGETYASVKE